MMKIENSAAPYARAVSPYVIGLSTSEVAQRISVPAEKIIRLSSNENPLGVPPGVVEAIKEQIGTLNRFPDNDACRLRQVLAARFAIPENWITLGNGSNEILEMAVRLFVERGETTVSSQFAFSAYRLATTAIGGRNIVVPAKSYGHDLEAMRRAVAGNTKVLFIANPNNPTGTFIPRAELESFLSDVPRRVLVILDEAYTEYLAAGDAYDGISLVEKFPNLLVCHTFSKAFGLAGIRVGFGVSQPEVSALLDRIHRPFSVNSLAQSAAIAALNDESFLRETAESNAQGITQLTEGFDVIGLRYIPPHGNFVCVRVGDARGATKVFDSLLAQGVIVRPLADHGLPEWIRVTVGAQNENRIFLQELAASLT
ncbi:histidinol-phosphate transaminase [Burkholderia sp. JPY481]